MKKPVSDEELMKEVASRLAAARTAAGFHSIPEVVERFGFNFHTYSSHEQGRRRPSREAAKRYARAFKSDPDFLRGEDLDSGDDIPTPVRPSPNGSFPPARVELQRAGRIPLYGQIEAGSNGKFIMNGTRITDVFCPPGLEDVPTAYAVRVYGTSMEPRFKAGETVWLNPELPVRTGDDVVVQLKQETDGDEMASYIKEFRSKSSRVLKLWQHNPEEGEPHELIFDMDKVFSVHKVVHHAMT
ncbi:MAG: repressor protein C [Delftia acidovorans]|nr:MAG: repressor protein C [Delftia acidovorans]